MKYLVPLLFLLTSCASFHCLKSGRLTADTVKVEIPVKFTEPGVRADTSILNPCVEWPEMSQVDTVYIDTGRLHIKIVPGKTIYVEGECDPLVKEVLKEVPVLVTNTVKVGYTFRELLGYISLAVVVTLVVSFIASKAAKLKI